MQWIEIPSSFMEGNSSALTAFLSDENFHSQWIEVDIFGCFACRVSLIPNWAFISQGDLVVHKFERPERSVSCWSLERRYRPNFTLNSHAPDLKFEAEYSEGGGPWHIEGLVRKVFLDSKPALALKAKLFEAKIKQPERALPQGMSDYAELWI